TLVQRGAGALHVGTGAFMNSQRERIVGLAARYRTPAVYNWREAVAAGGLMSYAPSITDAYHQAGIYAGRILKGEKPGDLPVMLPTKFEFVINVKTARRLALEIPDRLGARAEGVSGGGAASSPRCSAARPGGRSGREPLRQQDW